MLLRIYRHRQTSALSGAKQNIVELHQSKSNNNTSRRDAGTLQISSEICTCQYIYHIFFSGPACCQAEFCKKLKIDLYHKQRIDLVYQN